MHLEGFTCNQIKWSLADTNVEHIADKSMVLMDADTYAWHTASGMSVTAYNSTASGWFAKVHAGSPPDKLRVLYENGVNDSILALITQASKERSLTITDITLGYMMSHPFASVPVTAFNTDSQFEEGMHAADILSGGGSLPSSLIAELNQIKGLIKDHAAAR
jgi:aryl-alcohol dehydrogenase-like predicted oxidoreductase